MSRRAATWLGLVAASVISCTTMTTIQPVATPAGTPSRSPAIALTARWDDIPLRPEERELLRLLDDGEHIHIDLRTPDGSALAAAAINSGLHATAVPPDGVSIDGSPDRILALLDPTSVRSASLSDDWSVLRWIPVTRPIVAVPNPGRPYLVAGLPVDGSQIPATTPQRLVDFLASQIQTIDGRPYETASLTGDCGPDDSGSLTCTVSVTGSRSTGGRGADWWAAEARDPGTTGGRIRLLDPTLGGVPRPLLRAAEWIARQDPETLRQISNYTSCCSATWRLGAPGLIDLLYTRECRAATVPNVPMADTGCADSLIVSVDVAAGTIRSAAETPGT